MKKILISLSAIAIVAAVAVGATVAYFSDTEQSTGNTFTAGSLDLIFTDVTGDPTPISGPLFTLTDMKPGDTDERTVSLVVENNPACGQVSINVTEDKDNTCTEPELIDDTTCVEPNTLGELNDAVNFVIWKDNGDGEDGNCDNIMNYGETVLVSGPLTSNELYSIGELPTETADCYGIAYCFGTWNTDGTCNGAPVNNASQSDSFKADLIINALQQRTQFPNGCPIAGEWPTQN